MNQTVTTIGAICIGLPLVAGVWFLSMQPGIQTGTVLLQRTDNVRLYGNPKADTTIVEFSDVECPFCARLHPVLKRLVDESNGTINWEYRHLPLPMHKNAELGAVATECTAELSGEENFWPYLEELLDNQGNHSQEFYTSSASIFGIDSEAFISCLSSDSFTEQINADQVAAAAFGGRGTPFSVIKFADGSTKPVSGALPYAQWRALLQLK